jgi:hypothetical protein
MPDEDEAQLEEQLKTLEQTTTPLPPSAPEKPALAPPVLAKQLRASRSTRSNPHKKQETLKLQGQAARHLRPKRRPTSNPMKTTIVNDLMTGSSWASTPTTREAAARRGVFFFSNISTITLISSAIQDADSDPKSHTEARSRLDWPLWKAAMDKEITTLDGAGTWSTMARPGGKNIIGSKWVFRIERKSDGTVDRSKRAWSPVDLRKSTGSITSTHTRPSPKWRAFV